MVWLIFSRIWYRKEEVRSEREIGGKEKTGDSTEKPARLLRGLLFRGKARRWEGKPDTRDEASKKWGSPWSVNSKMGIVVTEKPWTLLSIVRRSKAWK